MSKTTLFTLIFLLISQQVFAFKTDFSVGVGPAWNQVLATDHFTVNSQDDQQAKSVIFALDNPCAAIAADLKVTFCNKYYTELFLYDICGNRGSVFFNQATQESPFSTITSLEGTLRTNVLEIGLISGVNWLVQENIVFTLAGGYLYFQANRPICFFRNNLNLRVHDVFQGGVIKFGPTISLNEKVDVSAAYLFGLGTLKSRIRSFPAHEDAFFNFPLYMNNIVALGSSYKINKEVTASVSALWYVAQNIKNGSVKQSPTDALLFSNRCATLFRSQFYFMTFNLTYAY